MSTSGVKEKLKCLWHKLFDGFFEDEVALVVSWFDVIVLLVFTMFIFMVLGPLMDQLWVYMHTAPLNVTMNGTSVPFYTQSDFNTSDDLYNMYKWLPYLALGVVVYYAINYSNMKKGGD